jgi:tRNA-intron endonuclease, archaea type
VSIGINEGINIKSKDFVDMIDQIENMGKDTVIAVIERRGEVIYYKTTKMSFFENKKKS